MQCDSDPTSIAWVCEHRPERVRKLFASLNLDRPEMSVVKAATLEEDWATACAALLAYYRDGRSGQWLRHAQVPVGHGTDPQSEKATRAKFPMPGRGMQIPRLPTGGLNWGYIPPEPGGVEWVYGINRHDYMTDVLASYFDTGNRTYVRCLDEQLRDWSLFVERPEKSGSDCPWGSILEAGHRAKVWPAVFYGLQCEAEFTPATRILLLSQALDHAEFIRKYHSHGSNWVITEMTGLLSIAAAWPEFREADEWRTTALRLAQAELREQVYPDGVQKELASNYQLAVLWHMGHFMATVRGAVLALEPGFAQVLERMWNYLAYSLGPTGFAPHNGDSDRCRPTPDSQVIKPLDAVSPLLEAARVFGRPDWTFIATQGADGAKPTGTPSMIFPWAGQVIMRSGWDADSHWAYFDIGPWGIQHQHYDALHLSVAAHGRDLLVDSGRYTYENYMGPRGSWRSYFVGSQAHNVILIDGHGQQDGPRAADQPVAAENIEITPDYDYAQGTFAHGFTDTDTISDRLKTILYKQDLSAKSFPKVEGLITHTRGVLYLRGVGWIVVDHIETDRPRRITPLWHFHPDCTVVCDGQSVVTTDEGVGNLRIVPMGPVRWEIELVRGREGPEFQGWYSTEMDVRAPNTCACYSATIPASTTMAWLLLPARGPVPAAHVQWLDAPRRAVHVMLEGMSSQRMEIAIRLDTASPLGMSTGDAMIGQVSIRKA